jgi:hypothetical protein
MGMSQVTGGLGGVGSAVLDMKQADADELASLADAQVTKTNAQVDYETFQKKKTVETIETAVERKDAFDQANFKWMQLVLDGQKQLLEATASRKV